MLLVYLLLCETDIENSGVNETRKQHGWVCALELALLAPFIVQFFHSRNAVNFSVIQFPPINLPSFKSGLTNKLICGKFRMAPDLQLVFRKSKLVTIIFLVKRIMPS